MLQHNAHGQDAKEVQRLLQELETANSVLRGRLIPAGKTGSLESVERVLGFVPACLKLLAAQQRLTLFEADFKARFAGRDSTRLFLDSLHVPGVLRGPDPLNKSLFVWAKSVLPNCILNLLGDRMEMAHSVEGRVPFLDHHVVECVGRAPVSLKIRVGAGNLTDAARSTASLLSIPLQGDNRPNLNSSILTWSLAIEKFSPSHSDCLHSVE